MSMEKFEGIIGNITTNNYPTFTNDEILGEEAGHNKALHVSVKCIENFLCYTILNTSQEYLNGKASSMYRSSDLGCQNVFTIEQMVDLLKPLS